MKVRTGALPCAPHPPLPPHTQAPYSPASSPSNLACCSLAWPHQLLNRKRKCVITIWGDLPSCAWPLQPWAEKVDLGDRSLHPIPPDSQGRAGSGLAAFVPPVPPTPSLCVRKSPSRLPCRSDSLVSALAPISDFLPSLNRGIKLSLVNTVS